MIAPDIPADEDQRLKALKSYSILDTIAESEYDDITKIASQICGTHISLISLIDEDRQWFKSRQGLDAEQTDRELAFCAHAINDKDRIFIIPDSREDERFFDNPLVTDDPNVIFYAGVPLVDSGGFALGTLCVIDDKPKNLNEDQITTLKALSRQVIKLLELRKTSHELNSKVFELEAQNKGLERFASVAAHDLKSPLSSIIMLAELLQGEVGRNLEPEGKEFVQLISNSSQKLTELIDGILKYTREAKLLSEGSEDLLIDDTIKDVIEMIDVVHAVNFKINIHPNLTFYTNKVALKQILINLITNAIKYNDKEQTEISIDAETDGKRLKIKVSDNGPGIETDDQKEIFNIFHMGAGKLKQGHKRYGIGLATVKSLVEGLSGTVSVHSKPGNGATFEFYIQR